MRYVRRMICSAIVFTAANSVFLKEYLDTWVICIVFFGLAWIQIAPQWKRKDIPLKRHRICAGGCELLIYFLLSTAGTAVYMLARLPELISGHRGLWIGNLLVCILVEGITFWNGILRVYACSAQIVKERIEGGANEKAALIFR